MNIRTRAAHAVLLLGLFTLAVLLPAPIGQYADPGSPLTEAEPPWFLRPVASLLSAVPEPVAWGVVLLVWLGLAGAVFTEASGRRPRLRWPRLPRLQRRLPGLRLRLPRLASRRSRRRGAAAETSPAGTGVPAGSSED